MYQSLAPFMAASCATGGIYSLIDVYLHRFHPSAATRNCSLTSMCMFLSERMVSCFLGRYLQVEFPSPMVTVWLVEKLPKYFLQGCTILHSHVKYSCTCLELSWTKMTPYILTERGRQLNISIIDKYVQCGEWSVLGQKENVKQGKEDWNVSELWMMDYSFK